MFDFLGSPIYINQLTALQMAFVFMTIFVVRSMIFAGTTTLWVQTSKWAKRHRVLREPVAWRRICGDVFHGLKILCFDMLAFVIAIKTGYLRLNDFASPQASLITFVAFFIGFEIFFYYSHRWMHKPRWYWIHRHHHQNRVTNPWSSLAFSYVERCFLLVAALVIPGLVSQWVAIPTAGISGYFLFNYIFNVYGHLNVEFMPPIYVKTFGRVALTTSFHALHHMRSRGHYGLFTRFLDRWHGTEFSDYEEVHARAFKGV